MLTHLKKRICALIPLRWRRVRKVVIRPYVNHRWPDLEVSTSERRASK